MRFALDEDQEALRASARRVLQDVATTERVLATMETEAEPTPCVGKYGGKAGACD